MSIFEHFKCCDGTRDRATKFVFNNNHMYSITGGCPDVTRDHRMCPGLPYALVGDQQTLNCNTYNGLLRGCMDQNHAG